MLEANQALIKSQNDLMIRTQKIEFIKSLNEKFEQSSIEFIHLAENFSLFMLLLELGHSEFKFQKNTQLDSYEFKLNSEIKEKVKQLYDSKVKLRFHFRSILESDDNEKELIGILDEVVSTAILLQNYLIENRGNFTNQMKNYKQKVANAELMLNTILKESSILKVIN